MSDGNAGAVPGTFEFRAGTVYLIFHVAHVALLRPPVVAAACQATEIGIRATGAEIVHVTP